jgi:dTDP-3-amino-3,4,6-trideoxy-alpha-D-glucose transaminase
MHDQAPVEWAARGDLDDVIDSAETAARHPVEPRPAMSRVPFVDLARADVPLRERLLAAVAATLDSFAYTNGPAVEDFEHAFAGYCGTRHCVGLASGLDALRLGLLAAGIRNGDEVLVPAATFVATLEAVTQAGGRPVLVDVRPDDYGIDPAAAEGSVTSANRVLLPVHLYGQMADMARLAAVAERHGIEILEDACQAHGARRDGSLAGTVGKAAAFSFYPAKNLGALGDAGALVTDDGALTARVRALREHGQTAKYTHEFEGYTARLDTIQAAVLLIKLPLLDELNAQRRAAAAFYGDALAGVGDLRLPEEVEGSEHVWHLYVIRTTDPAKLAEFLAERGIATGRHYPQPPHLAPAYEKLGYSKGSFPVAEALSRECLSLPLFPGITESELESVVESVAAFFGG